MPKIAPPETTPAFASERLNTFVFPFSLVFSCAVTDPTLLNYELQIDSLPTFATINKRSFTKTSLGIVSFNEGQVAKAFVVELPGRRNQQTSVWYWRVRINSSTIQSDWSEPQSFTVNANNTLVTSSSLNDAVVDEFVYAKEGNSTNISSLFHSFSQEKDQFDFEAVESQSDTYLSLVRDSRLAEIFGDLVSYPKTTNTSYPDYRHQLRTFLDVFLNRSGVVQGISEVVQAFVLEPPVITDLSSTPGWILDQNFIKDPLHLTLAPIITLYSRLSKGFNWNLTIYNSWGLSYDQTTLERWIKRVIPSHTKVTISYAIKKNACLSFNIAADWATCTLVGTTALGDAVTVVGAGGSVTTPVYHIPNMSKWGILELGADFVGQTITVQIRSSLTGALGTFSSYETIALGQAPVTTPLRDYIQMQILLSTTNVTNKPILNSLKLKLEHT